MSLSFLFFTSGIRSARLSFLGNIGGQEGKKKG